MMMRAGLEPIGRMSQTPTALPPCACLGAYLGHYALLWGIAAMLFLSQACEDRCADV